MTPSDSMPPGRISAVSRSPSLAGPHPRFSRLTASGRSRFFDRYHKVMGPDRPMPTQIADYSIILPFWPGPMSNVYLAKNPGDVSVVIKVASDRVDLKMSKKAIRREARALTRLKHPGIVRLRGMGISEGKDFLVLDYVEGVDLYYMLRDQGPLSWQSVRTIALQLCDALKEVHARKIIHHDLKPENIVISQTEALKAVLLDFGLALFTNSRPGDDLRIDPGTIAGTIPYMAPEHFSHTVSAYDVRTDVYALGLLMYEMLVGGNPFERHGSSTGSTLPPTSIEVHLSSDHTQIRNLSDSEAAPLPEAPSVELIFSSGHSLVSGISDHGRSSAGSNDPAKIVDRILHSVPNPPSTWIELPPYVDGIVMQAISRDPADRFSSVQELRSAILSRA